MQQIMTSMTNTNADKPKRYQCRHIFTDGHRCGSPCLRGEELCYYHHTTRQPVTGARRRHSRRSAFDLPPARRPLRHPILHRPGPPAHSL